MEFHENRPVRPFIGFVLFARWIRNAWRRYQTRHILQQLNEHQLRDIGLTKEDVSARKNDAFWNP